METRGNEREMRRDDRANEARTMGGQGSGTYQGGVPVMRETMPTAYRENYRDMYRGYRQDKAMEKKKNIFHREATYKKYSTADEVFECIVDHLTKGVMFHDKMMDLYSFLGLEGFKKIHEYQYFSESMLRRKVKTYVIDHLNLLIDDQPNDEGLNFIPAAWYTMTRHDVTPDARVQYVGPSFSGYQQWEEETKELLSYCANELMYMGQMADFNFVMEMVEDVEEELHTLEQLMLKLKAVNWEMSYLVDMQADLRTMYEKKLEECFEEKIECDKKEERYRLTYPADPDAAYATRRNPRTGRYTRRY